MNQGKLTLREVGSRSIDVTFDQKDPWVVQALKMAAPHEDICGKSPQAWAESSELSGEAKVERLDPEYSIQGNFQARVPVLCPRCGADGTVGRGGEFRLFVKPMGPYDKAEEGDDPDYIFLETPYIDFAQIISEQLVAVEPVVEYPDQELSGEPHPCTQDLHAETELYVEQQYHSASGDEAKAKEFNLSSGQNEGKARNSPFAVLGKLKDLSVSAPESADSKNAKKSKE